MLNELQSVGKSALNSVNLWCSDSYRIVYTP